MEKVAILLPLILATAMVALSQNLWTNNGDLDAATKKCSRLTRAAIEEKLGKPTKCATDSKDVECWGRELAASMSSS